MAVDKRFTDLPVASSLATADIMAMVDPSGNITYQFTFAQLLSFISANASLGAHVSVGTSNPTSGTGVNGDVFINTTTNQFLQKQSGTWVTIYTVASGVVGSVFTFGAVAPTASGNTGDIYLNTATGGFYKNTSTGGSGTTWTLQYTQSSGPAGPRGNSILNSAANPTSSDGTNGDFWLNTTTNTLYGPKAAGVWPGTGLSLSPATPNTILNGITAPSSGVGNNGDFYLNTNTYYLYGPKAAGAWPAGVSLFGSIQSPARVNFPVGTALPIVFSSFSTAYSAYGSSPKFRARKITGGALVTATITTAATTASVGTYSAQAVVNNTGIYNSSGIGASATATITVANVSGSIKVTGITIIAGGSGYYVGDTFTIASIPGAIFTVASNTEIYYQDLTAAATITIGEVNDLVPDSVSIQVDDDGTAHLQDNLQIIISI